MEIEQIIAIAKDRMGSTSLTDRTLTEYFNTHSPNGEPTEDYWESHVPFLKSLSGQFSHDVASWTKQYEKEHPKQVKEPSTPNGIDPKIQELLDGYKSQIDEMKTLMMQQREERTAESMRVSAVNKGQDLKVVYGKLWEDVVSRTPISKGMTQEQFDAQVKVTYEQNLQYFGDGVIGYSTSNPSDPRAKTKATLDAFFAKKGMPSDDNNK